MNNQRFDLWMHAVDDDLLEEAQRPAKRGRALKGIAGGIAACLVLAFALQGFLPAPSSTDHTAIGNPVTAVTAAEVAQIGYTIPLPEDAESCEWSLIRLNEDSVPMAEVSFARNDEVYTCRALKTEQAEDISGIYAQWDQTLDWVVGGLELQLRQSGSDTAWVGWYEAESGTQWCLSGSTDALSLLHTAQALVEELGYDLAVAPEGAEDPVYNAFALDGLAVGETVFVLNGITYSYRMAATSAVEEGFADISGDTNTYPNTTTGDVQWCPARLGFEEGGAGTIVWFDIAPGLLYSLHMDSGATENSLLHMAQLLFAPAQEQS